MTNRDCGSVAARNAAADRLEAESKAIIHAGAHDVHRKMRAIGDGERDKSERAAAVAEVEIEVFELGAPARREGDFDAAARSPAVAGLMQAEARYSGPCRC